MHPKKEQDQEIRIHCSSRPAHLHHPKSEAWLQEARGVGAAFGGSFTALVICS